MATIPGTDQPDSLLGGVEDDLLQGLEGADTLDGAEGIDTLEGGTGDDVFVVGETRRTIDGITDDWEDVVVEGADAGTDTVIWTGIGRYALGANIENAVAGAFWSGTLEGNELDNDLTGWGDEGNYLEGGDGADTLRGGGWDDNLIGGAGNDLLIGQNDLADLPGTIDGDDLDGGEGADTMIGGDGYDHYWADDLGDTLIEDAPPADSSELEAYYYSLDSVTWTGAGVYELADNVEYLYLRGGSTEALGNDQANILWSEYGSYDEWGELIGDLDVTLDGAGGDDIILGGSGGSDELFGGDGSDRIEGNMREDTLHGGAGDDDLHGDSTNFWGGSNDTLFGDEGDDLLTGGLANDSLAGGDGIDVLIGDYGNDTLAGGAGADRFSGGADTDVVLDFSDGEDLILGDISLFTITQDGADTLITYPGQFGWDAGTLRLIGIDATIITAEDFLSPLSGDDQDNNLNGNGADEFISAGEGDDQVDAGGGNDGAVGGLGADTMDGGNGADTLNGGLGDDTIDGGAGADLLSGGSGNDSYFISLGGDVVHEDEKGGVDKVESAVDHKLGANVENLVLGDAASAAALAAFTEAHGLMGMAIAGPGAGRLDGIGNALANKITGSSEANLLAGKGGNDRLIANDGADVLKGDAGNDQLKGGAGADTLTGGANNDVLTGGADADVFAFAGVSGRDRITDFVAADGDRVRIDSPAATRFRDLDIASDGNGSSIVEWAGNRITLAGVDSASLRAKHFEFVQQPEAAPLSAFGENSEAATFAWSPAMPAVDTPFALV